MKATRLWLPLIVIGTLVWCGLYFIGPALTGRISYAREEARQRAIRENLPYLKQADGLSALLREVSRAVRPAVVEVRVLQKTEWEGRRFRSRLEGGAIGSGVIVDKDNGYIVTNWHVVSKAGEITVVLADGREVTPEWVRFDRMTDLAVVKIASERLLDIPVGDSDKVEVGDQVLAIGSPMKLPQTVTFGRISAKGRMITARSDTYQNYLQTDAAINNGNSGGPLINMAGEIIGINTAIVSESGTNAGVGLSIPSNRVKRVTRQLIEDGKATRGFIGLAFRAITKEAARELKLPHTRGALVIMVAPGGPADLAGIKEGDFILSVNSRTIENSQEFRHIVADIKPGTTIPIELYRNGETIAISVRIVLQPDDMSDAFRP